MEQKRHGSPDALQSCQQPERVRYFRYAAAGVLAEARPWLIWAVRRVGEGPDRAEDVVACDHVAIA